jgi:SAM-dependent methyltransferase
MPHPPPHSTGNWAHLVAHYDRCLAEGGHTPAGVDWPNPRDLEVRFATQLSVLNGVATPKPPRILDIGCGTGLLLDYMRETGLLERVEYLGVDLSSNMIAAASARWPGQRFAVRDICADPFPDGSFDVAIMNGVLTERLGLPQAEMIAMAKSIITAAFRASTTGLAFNVMNKHVDWERDDLFHWEFDALAAFLKAELSRHYHFRADYGLYEYTAFVWHAPQRPQALGRAEWWR